MLSAVRFRRSRVVVAIIALAFLVFLEFGCGGGVPDGGSGNSNSQQVMYVGNLEANTVSGYRIDTNGSLAALSGSPFALGGITLVGDPDRKALFSLQLDTDTIHLNTNRINPDGSLKVSSSITDDTLAGVEAINPAGTALYVSSINAAEENRGWKVYSIQADGSLQFLDGLIDQMAGRLVFTPEGSTAFSAYCYHLIPNIEQFAVASNGMLTNARNQITTPVAFGECPNAVALAPTGSLLAAPWSDESNPDPALDFITLFSVDPSTHGLFPAAGSVFPASGAGKDITFDPSGNFLITAQDNGIGIYKVSANSLTEVKGSPFSGKPLDRVMFTPSGVFVVAVSRVLGQVLVFSFDSTSGAVTMAPGSPVSTSSPYDLAIISR